MLPPLRAVLTGTEPFVMQEMGVARSDRLTSLAHLSDEGLVSSVWIPLKGEQEARGVLVVGYRSAHEFSGRELRLLLSMAEKTSIAATNASLYEDLLAREQATLAAIEAGTLDPDRFDAILRAKGCPV